MAFPMHSIMWEYIMKLRIVKEYDFLKVGVNEVKGLREELIKVVEPIQDILRDKAYWDKYMIFEDSEYISRDGFIPHSDNHGGLEIGLHVPECEKYDFDFMGFGEWDGEHYCDKTDTENCECPFGSDGEYDAYMRIWLKFEGIQDGFMHFYLVMSGGNDDVPYFKSIPTLFEAEFKCKTLSQISKVSKVHINKLVKMIK